MLWFRSPSHHLDFVIFDYDRVFPGRFGDIEDWGVSVPIWFLELLTISTAILAIRSALHHRTPGHTTEYGVASAPTAATISAPHPIAVRNAATRRRPPTTPHRLADQRYCEFGW